MGASVFGGISAWFTRRDHAAVTQQRRLVDQADARYRREKTAAVTETLTTAINEELGPRGTVAFPTQAPRMVELDTSAITPSATVNYVQEFICCARPA